MEKWLVWMVKSSASERQREEMSFPAVILYMELSGSLVFFLKRSHNPAHGLICSLTTGLN
jgi:hypothetical protein